MPAAEALPPLRVCLLAETVGTFALVFAGTGAIVVNEVTGCASVTHVGVAMTFGLVVLAMVYTLGSVSGAHLNPAVTASFWAAGRFPTRRVFPYAFAQTVGALLASGLLRLLFGGRTTLGATLPANGPGQSFVLEIVLTFLLVLVILSVARGARETGLMAGVAVGATVGLEALFAGPISGASMNPARSLAPGLVGGHYEALWVYLSAPFIGGMLAVVVHKALHTTTTTPSPLNESH